MKYLIVVLLGIIYLSSGCGTHYSVSKKEIDMDTDSGVVQHAASGPDSHSGVTKLELPNGMTVLLEENHSSPVVAVNVWVKIGSACEQAGEYGLAHVHEHMVFKGTKRRGVGEIARVIESNGGDINAFTSFDHTVYFVEIASRFLDTALDVLSDAMENSAFDPEELEKELEVVVEEIRRGEDSPTRKLNERLFGEAFSEHPYRRPIIGTKESVRSFTRDRVVNFYKKWYAPNNMVVVLVGDFNSDDVLPKLQSTFGSIKSRPLAECFIPDAKPQNGLKKFVFTREVNEGYFSFAFHGTNIKSEDTPVLDVISYILGGGDSSRLYRRVKEEKGLVNNIYTYSYTPMREGLFIISGTLDPERASPAIGEILTETYGLKYSPVSTEELERAKVNIESDSIYARETMHGQAQKLGFFESDVGDFRYERSYLAMVASVTPEDIMRVAKKYFNSSNLTLGFVFPNEKETVGEGDIAEIVASADKRIESEHGDTEAAGTTDTEKKVRLPNGITLIVKENRSVPIFSARAVLRGGVRYEDDQSNGLSNFVCEVLTRGTKNRTAEEIAREIENLAGSVNGFSGRNSIGLTLEALAKNFDQAMEIFADVLLNPSFDREEIERARRDIISDINRQEDNPMRTSVNLFLETLYEKHPYRLNPLGKRSTVEGFGAGDLKGFYNRVAKPENLVIAVAGDVPAEHVIDTVKRLFGGMKKGGFKHKSHKPEPPIKSVRTAALERKENEQAHIIMGFLAPRLNDPDEYAFEVLNSILSGQGGRLFIELRDKQSLAYTVTSFFTPGIENGYFGIYIATAPQKEDEAIEGIKFQLKLVLERGGSKAEIDRAQNYLVGNFEIGLQQNSSQSAKMAFDEIYGVGWDDYKNYARNIYAVTGEDITRVAKKYLDVDNYVLVIVSPGKDSVSN
ncbi:MAG: insulinase family protein [Candidatus Dadabacteria bacterium]|nr:insulinase family protein [Candidatus Dadabacteria bacterium]